MKLTKKGEYALRAMMGLGNNRGESMTISAIAEQQFIPKKFLEQILLSLKARGLVTSKAGPRGGYELAQPLARISIGEILRAVEEPLSQSGKVKLASSNGRTLSKVAELLDDLRQYTRERLDGLMLQDLVSENLAGEEVEALMWYI
ncbi:MAG: Rrf2 family transcriptional regulator [Candidatus Sumerlaeaceae bacterium]|nr:Rrf2 family transcriptional regulator [Candidatus Sumerlaeaceae bacterium]